MRKRVLLLALFCTVLTGLGFAKKVRSDAEKECRMYLIKEMVGSGDHPVCRR